MEVSTIRRFTTALAVAAALSPAIGGAQGRIRPVLAAGSYFPLQAGTAWTYQRSGSGATTEWTADVSAEQHPPRALPYFVLEGYFPGPAHAVRSDPFGTVTERSSGYRDFLWYLLGATEGTAWTLQLAPSPLANPLPDCVGGSKLTLAARGIETRVPAGEFTDVVRVDWASPCVDAGITSEWFAPGVGLIRRQETSIVGVVTSELVRAHLGDVALPRSGFLTSLTLGQSSYLNNLMPPADASALPKVLGAFTVSRRPDDTAVFSFDGCAAVSIVVLNESGDAVVSARSDDGGCCSCKSTVEWDFSRGPLVLPFAFRLAPDSGEPLPDGSYAVSVTLESRDAAPLRPAARARIEVRSIH